MSHIADTFNGLGFPPLQHKGCIDQGWDVATMDSVICVRSLGRERTGDNAGAYTEDPDARGNLGGAVCWPVPRSSVRKIAMWNFAFASIVVGGGKATSSGSAFTVSGASATGSEDYACLPIRDEVDTPDTRFSTLVIRRPGGHPKYPLGTLGVVLGTTEENRQVERFLHCDPRLIAVNASGDPGMGSLVCDLTPENKIDDKRTAPLQSAFRVLKLPGGAVDDLGDNFLAFQLSNSGRGDTGGGFVYDAAAGDVIGQLSKMFSGIIDVGGAADQHRLGTDADGHPINAAHLPEEVYFRSRTGARDGPLKFDGNYVPCPRAPYLTQTFWTWDGSITHDFVLGPRAGKYRWEGTSYKYEPSTPTPPTTGKPPTEVPPPKPPPDEPTGGPPGKGKPPTKEPPPDKPPVPSGGGDTGTPGGGWPGVGPAPGGGGDWGFPDAPSGDGTPAGYPPGWGPPPPGWGDPPKGGGKGPPGAGMPPGPGGAPPGGGVPLPGAAPGGTIRVGVGRRGGGFGGWWQGLRRVWGGLVGFGPGGRPGANWVPPPPGRDPNAGAALGNRVRKLDLRPRGPRAPGVPPNPLDPNAGRDKVGPPVNSPGFGGGDLGLKGGIPPSALPPAPRTLAPVGRLPNTYSGVPAAGAPVVGARGPGEYRRVTAEPIETLHGPISFRPQDQRPGSIDFRNWMTPEFQAMRVMDHTVPVVCRLEPYGAQGGTAGVGPLLGAAGAGDPWVKTLGPGVRYPGGTAAGGIVFLPAGLSLTDLMLSADGVTVPAAYFTLAPGTYLALGTPDLAGGGIISGLRASATAAGLTSFEGVDSSGAGLALLDFTAAADVVVNESGSALVGFRVEGDNDANLIYTDPQQDRVGVGTASPDAKLTVDGTFHCTGKATIDGLVDPTGLVLDDQATVPGGTPAAGKGTLWEHSTQKTPMWTNEKALDEYISRALFCATADATVGNTADAGSIAGTGVGTMTTPANYLLVGKTIRLRASGYVSFDATAAQTLQVTFYYGSTVLIQTAAIDVSGFTVSNMPWSLDCEFTVRSLGATGTAYPQSHGGFRYFTDAVTERNEKMSATAAVTIDTTASTGLRLLADWNSADTGDTITCTNLTLESLE